MEFVLWLQTNRMGLWHLLAHLSELLGDKMLLSSLFLFIARER